MELCDILDVTIGQCGGGKHLGGVCGQVLVVGGIKGQHMRYFYFNKGNSYSKLILFTAFKSENTYRLRL